jgi:hypothetical protein
LVPAGTSLDTAVDEESELQKGFLIRSGCHTGVRPVRNIRRKGKLLEKVLGARYRFEAITVQI